MVALLHGIKLMGLDYWVQEQEIRALPVGAGSPVKGGGFFCSRGAGRSLGCPVDGILLVQLWTYLTA